MKTVKELVAEANAQVQTVPVAAAIGRLNDPETVFIDLRDSAELQQEGKIPGAVHANRGMLEFLIDPTSPYHNPVFASGKKFLFYCAGGGRSAMAAFRAQCMGLTGVSHLGGGLKAWKEAGGAIEPVR